MDRDDTPRALDAELLEEGGRHHSLGRHESIGVQQRTANNADKDDRKAATKDSTSPAADCAACHCTEVGNNLRNSNCISGELELSFEERGVEILRAMAL